MDTNTMPVHTHTHTMYDTYVHTRTKSKHIIIHSWELCLHTFFVGTLSVLKHSKAFRVAFL